MQRRSYLKLLAASAGMSATSGMAVADTGLDCGVWYDAQIDDNTDGDTFDVYVYETGETYNVRNLGFDTPETPSNSRYEKTEEWEFIEDQKHLENWGTKAANLAEDELPAGTEVQVQHDCESEKVDVFGRALMRIRYDDTGDGSMDTVWGERVLEGGYGRVYAASMSKTDEYLDLQEQARANDAGVWIEDDGYAPEVKNEDVAETFHPHTSSIRTTNGALADSRAPLWAESEATQDNTSSGTVDYSSGSIPLVGVDEANNLAYFGGQSINEAWESDSEALEHFVFVTNLIKHLNGGRQGHVLVDGGHHTFNPTHALSGEDVAFYQRFLEGQGIELHSINTYGDSSGYSLSDARALIVTGGEDAWTSSEVSEVSNFISNGGAVLLMGSHGATSTQRSNLDDLAADLGTDLRLNDDEVHDDTNNVGNQDLLATSNFNTADFSLWSAYSESDNASPTCSTVNPGDGDTVSGTVTVQVDASDSEDDDDSLDVDVSIDGGSWLDATYDSDSGYYEYDWDTTGVDDDDHTIDARATDSDGATTNAAQVTVTVDNVEDAPTVDSLGVSEVETDDSDAEFDATWSVSDNDGDLDSVDLVLEDTTAGETEDSVTVDVSGDSASGTTRLVAAGDDGSGNSYDVTATVTDSNGNTDSSTTSVTESEPQILDADPDSAGASSYHTWTLADPSDDYSGEVDTITVDYPSGTSLDGLTDEDVTVYMDRDGDGTVDEIEVNSDSYSGSTATFDLDGRYNTSVEGEVRVEIDGVTNPDSGSYVATETLEGDDTLSVDTDFVVTATFAVSTDAATDVTENEATLNGSLDDLDGADSADCYFEWRESGADTWNTTSTQTLSSTGSFSEGISDLSASTDYEFRAVADASDGDSDTGDTLTFTTDSDTGARTDVLDADPNTAGSSSYHTWTLSDPSDDFSGEVDTITVDYPDGTSLDGLTDEDVTVYMDRDGDGTVDEIRVNSDSYSGSTDTFDLDGRYNTSVEGEVRVEIDGVTNPDAGTYVATETLEGDDTLSVDAEFVVE